MADRPILFSYPMVCALLDGRKTQTRRICAWTNNPHTPDLTYIVPLDEPLQPGWFGDEEGEVQFFSGYAPGDRLWVRESYYHRGHWWQDENDLTPKGKPKWKFAAYDREITFDPPAKFLKARSRANPSEIRWYKRLGRFMPRWASRLTLTVTDVRIERLQAISEADAIAEGIETYNFTGWGDEAGVPSFPEPDVYRGIKTQDWTECAAEAYAALWNNINGAGAWEENPWVVAITFTVARHNIDAPDLPEGLWMQGDKMMFRCLTCGKPSEWPAEPEDFDIENPSNVCGGSPRCCP